MIERQYLFRLEITRFDNDPRIPLNFLFVHMLLRNNLRISVLELSSKIVTNIAILNVESDWLEMDIRSKPADFHLIRDAFFTGSLDHWWMKLNEKEKHIPIISADPQTIFNTMQLYNYQCMHETSKQIMDGI